MQCIKCFNRLIHSVNAMGDQGQAFSNTQQEEGVREASEEKRPTERIGSLPSR